jgi:hypothetical protein
LRIGAEAQMADSAPVREALTSALAAAY